MKIIVVCANYNKYVHDICIGLEANGYKINELLIGTKVQKILFKLDSIKRIYKRHGILEVARRWKQRRREQTATTYLPVEQLARIQEFTIKPYDFINGGRTLSYLAQDRGNQIVILAGSGIVDAAFIRCAGSYVVNGHPAILPGYRGVDVVEWALHDCNDVGVSAHLVTQKVDAGEILHTRKVIIQPMESYAEFRERVTQEQAKVLVDGVIKLLNGETRFIKNCSESSKLCFVSDAKIRNIAIQNFKSMQKNLCVRRQKPFGPMAG